MKVKALKGFVHFKPDGDWIVAQPGQVLEMPKGADWVKSGLAEVMPEPEMKVETMDIQPGEVSAPVEARRKKRNFKEKKL